MFFGKRNILHDETTLLVDIRNSYVCLSVLRKDKEVVHVITSKKYQASPSASLLSGDNLQKHLDASFSDFVQNSLPKLASGKNAKIKDALVVFSAPWYKAQMTHVRFKKETPVLFTKDLYNSLIAKESILNQTEAAFLEKNITHILLNNYELTDPFGKPATDVDIAFYLSLIDANTEKMVTGTLEKHMPKIEASLHSSGFVNFQTIRNTFVNISSFIFFDMGSDVTEIGVIRNNVFDALLTIPFGKKHLMEAISKECKLDPAQTQSSLNILAKGDMDDSCGMSIFQVMKKESEAWAEELGKVVSQLGDSEALPHKIFLFSESEIEPFANMLLKSEIIQKKIFNSASSDIILIEKEHVSDQIKNDSAEAISLDSLLIVKALFSGSVKK